MKKILVAILICSFSSFIYAEDAPFGLTWGSSPQDITSLNITLKKESTDKNISTYSTSSLPKNISIAGQYLLIFDDEAQLQKIVMVSKDITGDPYGRNGKEIYEKIKNGLTKKYGTPKNTYEQSGIEVYKESDEFYQCLNYDGCGTWISFFESEQTKTNIVLQLEGLSRGTGYIKILYESGKWSKIIDKHDAIKNKSDNDSL